MKIGVLGGSGFYRFFEDVQEDKIDTPYGAPSDKIARATYKGNEIYFLPRHSKSHDIPPHQINYRANIWALKQLGATHIVSPCAAGSLTPNIQPGDFVVPDQFIDRTKGRIDTFYDGPITTHISGAEPFCPKLRDVAINAIESAGVSAHKAGTIVVINGPRFSSKAESQWFSKMGWDVVNMTQYPEMVLARELEMCFISIALVTDYDIGVDGVSPVTPDEMVQIFKQNMVKIRDVLFGIFESAHPTPDCYCQNALQFSRFND